MIRASLPLMLLLGCVPQPQSVREARTHFPRDHLVGTVILEHVPEVSPLGAVFDGRVELLGVTLEPPRPQAGEAMDVRFYFRVRRPLFDDFMIFVHGDPAGGPTRRLFGDHWPAGGAYPTGMWQAGEVIEDHFRFNVPRDYAGAHVRVFTGLYRGDLRLPLTDAGGAGADRENRSLAFELAL